MQLLKSENVEFAAQFQMLVNERREVKIDVSGTVRDIINDVRLRGDVAVKDYTTRFDKFRLGFPMMVDIRYGHRMAFRVLRTRSRVTRNLG